MKHTHDSPEEEAAAIEALQPTAKKLDEIASTAAGAIGRAISTVGIDLPVAAIVVAVAVKAQGCGNGCDYYLIGRGGRVGGFLDARATTRAEVMSRILVLLSDMIDGLETTGTGSN